MPSRSSSMLLQRHHHVHELLGPRPAPLKLATPEQPAEDLLQLRVSNKKRRLAPPQQQRQPVIIFVESPKVVHAHPSEFKSVVQRLTGAPPPALLHPHHQFPFQLYGEQLPGAGRLDVDDSTTLPPLLQVSTGLMMPARPAAAAAFPFLFDHHRYHNDMVTVAATTGGSSSSHHQLATLLVSAADPFLPPLPSSLLGASFYHAAGDLFVNQ